MRVYRAAALRRGMCAAGRPRQLRRTRGIAHSLIAYCSAPRLLHCYVLTDINIMNNCRARSYLFESEIIFKKSFDKIVALYLTDKISRVVVACDVRRIS